ncbi:hypothetical protein K402DRAFT_402304 [Aulographum hederae CBS 113979]|uniref:N-acetyltransferase domain-containing protein n=1 Tax=Aulographum hederae CBS 113979 TaxID=1176131 RepID=A0A6G1H7Y5_9PEZI|nr:hypothetical protein K402DRAFT_402304 [Aulographum hederae CBS 113979]
MEQAFAAAAINFVEPKSSLKGFSTVFSSNNILQDKLSASRPETFSSALPKSAVSTYPDEVRVVPIEEYKEAAQCLAEAFAVDEVARYFLDTPDRGHWSEKDKWDLHVSIMEYLTYAHCLKGLVTTIGPNYGAVALWMPPGKNMDDFWTNLRCGMWRLNYKLSSEGKKRYFDEFMPLLHDTKASVMGPRDNDSWYLVYIGTKPSSRGRGYARRLIEDVTELADLEGKACYLESSNEVNPQIYAKMGFEYVKRVHLQRAMRNVVMDIMVREPREVETESEGSIDEKHDEKLGDY